jgi:signal transduction histidine kinase/CheY-like chemotaxis protein/HPt (histidine-containing phosphotransfer) domain-containing protein
LSIDRRFLKGNPGKVKKTALENFKQLLFVFLAFLLMVLVSYFFTSGIVEKHIVTNAKELMNTAESMIHANLRDAEISILNVSFSLQNQMDNGQSGEDIKDYLVQLTEWMLKPETEVPGFLGFYGQFRGEYFDGNNWQPPDDFTIQERPWYIAARKNAGGVGVSLPYHDLRTGRMIISVSRVLRGKAGEEYGVIALDLNVDRMIDYVRNLKFAEGGYGMLVAPDFTILAHPDPYYIGRYMEEISEEHRRIVEELREGSTDISEVRFLNYERVWVVGFFKKLENDWCLGIATPLNSYYRDVFFMALVLSLLGFVLMIVLCYFLLRLGAAKIRSDEENKSKSSFLARMSHEIRTPMNSIMGMAELIVRRDISPDIMEYVSLIRQSGATLLAIINDILDFSKIESGLLQIESKQYSLASMINDIVNIFRVRFTEKPVDFFVHVNSDIPVNLIGDPVRIRQVLTNLLNNAEKYTPAGYVSLEVHMEKLDGNSIKLIIKVSDSGIGIKAEDIDKLFHDFTRVDMDRNQAIEGTGLGLTIAHSICHAMGGDITISSEYGRGSVFTASMVQQYHDEKKVAQVDDGAHKRVLLYEERFSYADSILTAFKTLGINPVCSPNLAAFLKDMEEGAFDFAFISSKHSTEAMRIWGKRHLSVKLIIMVELGDASAFKNTGSILMPVYSISLANILNGVIAGGMQHPAEGGIRLTAPSARILVVDDIATNLRVAVELMAPYKMIIDTCLSGPEAIEMVQEYRYDIIFMDHMMPQMDGVQATAIIREMGKQDPYYRNLPIIALTANAIFGQREMFLNNGIDDFLAKPIEMSKLNAILEQWIPREKQIKIVNPERQEIAGMVGLPEIKGIDVKVGLQNTGGSPEAYLWILSVFCRDAEERIAKVKEAADAGDLPLYTTLVHALKSACRSIGALSCGDLAAKLEEAGNNRNEPAISHKTGEFLSELRSLTDSIQAILEQDAGEKKSSDTAGLTSIQLEILKEALLNMDITMVNKLITEYTSKSPDKKTRDFIADIEQHILLFEYDRAVEKIDTLL